jgi:hypothetical protein
MTGSVRRPAMATDPEALNEVLDPIAEDEVEVVETGDVNERTEGEESVVASNDAVDVESSDQQALEARDDSEVTIEKADGMETDT